MLCIYNYIFLIKLSNGFVVFVNKRCCVGLSDGFVGITDCLVDPQSSFVELSSGLVGPQRSLIRLSKGLVDPQSSFVARRFSWLGSPWRWGNRNTGNRTKNFHSCYTY